jgi:pimeloyl-ACP methyl ester carboxylesterase
VLAQDALALIAALKYDSAVLIGHDWGAAAAYRAAAAAPQKISRLITIAVPSGPQFFPALATDYAQQRRSWYMSFFRARWPKRQFATTILNSSRSCRTTGHHGGDGRKSRCRI